MSLLRYAEHGDYTGCLNELDHGTDPNMVNDNNWTPLHWTAYNDHRKCLHLLLERQANPHCKDILGRIPLFWAICNDREYCIQVLLQTGLDYLNGDTWTPSQWEMYEHYQNCIRFLYKKYERFDRFDRHCITDNPEIKELTEKYKNIVPNKSHTSEL